MLDTPVAKAWAVQRELRLISMREILVEARARDEDIIIDDQVVRGVWEARVEPLWDILPHLLGARHLGVALKHEHLPKMG